MCVAGDRLVDYSRQVGVGNVSVVPVDAVSADGLMGVGIRLLKVVVCKMFFPATASSLTTMSFLEPMRNS